MDDENGGKAMNPMDSVFDLEKLRAALPLGAGGVFPAGPGNRKLEVVEFDIRVFLGVGHVFETGASLICLEPV